MNHYSDLPPTENTNSQDFYAPPPYQNAPGYYQPQPPYRPYAYSVWRVIGLVALTWFVLAVLIGHHGFFWLILLVGLFFFFRGRYHWGGHYRPYGRSYYRYNQPNAMPYNYYPNPQQPGYYPPQPPQSYPPTGTGAAGWPTPTAEPGPDQTH